MMDTVEDIIENGWNAPKNNFYNLTTTKNKQTTTNENSYYGYLFPDRDFSVEVSNQKMLSSLSENGLIKTISFFREAYYTEDKPGTWVSNGFVQERDLATEIETNGQVSSLTDDDHRIEFDLLHNLVPRFIHDYGSFKVLQLFLPIYLKSGQAVSGLIELCAVNKNDENLKLIFPRCYHRKYSDRHDLEFSYSENSRVLNKKSGWVILTDPNAVFDAAKVPVAQTIVASYQTVLGKFGHLEMPKNKQLAALIIRKADSALDGISCSTTGKVVGANWGSSPVVSRTWLRDMFYSVLPALYFDHELLKQAILWFSKFEIKPKGTKFKGGIQHSVENSLNSTILLSLYLSQTEDNNFIKQNPQVWKHVLNVVDYLIDQRDQKYGLIKSQWISDGIALGEFHTGTQITFWAAVSGIGQIYRHVLKDAHNATFYEQTAADIKDKIQRFCLIENKQGLKRYPEGVNPTSGKLWVKAAPYEQDLLDQGLDFLTRVTVQHRISLNFHDGEESDTTLAPFYGFNHALDQNYLNTLKFAASKDNPTYSTLSRGISWGNQSEATFPGYITTLMGTIDEPTQFNERIDLLEKLSDLDGSWWWWPYEVGSSGNKVMRFNHCGKCGWSDGTFSVLMIKAVLGINFDAFTSTLTIAPLKVVPGFKWHDFPLTNRLKADISYIIEEKRKSLKVSLRGKAQRTIKVNFQPQGWSVNKSTKLTTNQSIHIKGE